MFSAVTLRGTLDTALTDMDEAEKSAKQQAVQDKKPAKEQASKGKAAREEALKTVISAIASKDRLGLGPIGKDGSPLTERGPVPSGVGEPRGLVAGATRAER